MRILVIAPSWVGDMVMAQSLFITLKQQHPNCQIDVVAPSWTLALTQAMPEVSQGFVMSAARGKLGLLERIKLGKSLRQYHYDQAILLPNTWKSALIPFFANIPKRTGYIGECRWGLLNDPRKLDKRILTMTVQRFVALGLPSSAFLPPEYPIPRLVISQDQQTNVIEKFQLSKDRDLNKPSLQKILALCPGAEYGEAKRWPINHYAEVAKQKLAEGWKVWLFGSEKDKETAEQINNQVSGACIDFTGRTSLAEAVDLMSLVDTVVSNDSGLMHVAAALDKNIIALYGSSDPGFTPPLNDKAKVISLKLACSPCFKRVCPLGHADCLTGITPDAVLRLIQE